MRIHCIVIALNHRNHDRTCGMQRLSYMIPYKWKSLQLSDIYFKNFAGRGPVV